MSFNRLNYDTCSYKHVLAESVGTLEYQLSTPKVSCDPCYPRDPKYRLQNSGVSVSKKSDLIDIDSELMNINRGASNCPSKKFIPNVDKNGEINNNEENIHFKECDTPNVEDTRLSNPPSNLRGTGWNRWEWLCEDPQERVLIPFDYNINNRLIVKDNHRPCIPKPINQNAALPKVNFDIIHTPIAKVPAVPTDPPSVHWQSSETIGKY
jgi:hypothetical protein